MEAIKDGATKRINRSRREAGMVWQPRFFDRALRTVGEDNEKVQYIHLNPVKTGLVKRTEDWPWWSVHDYTGNVNDAPLTASGLAHAFEITVIFRKSRRGTKTTRASALPGFFFWASL